MGGWFVSRYCRFLWFVSRFVEIRLEMYMVCEQLVLGEMEFWNEVFWNERRRLVLGLYEFVFMISHLERASCVLTPISMA